MIELDSTASLDAPASAPAWYSWLEAAALCSLALTAGALVAGRDPVLRPGLAWLAVAPLLAGLRYGTGRGVACGAVLAGALLAAARWGGVPAEVPLPEVALGWLVAGLLPGQFRDAWARRLATATGEAADLRARLGRLSTDYHAIRISHDRLQREAPGSPFTLRDTLAAFERELAAAPLGSSAPEAFGARVLALFRECASVRAATLHLLDGQGAVGPAVAALGADRSGVPAGEDPIVQEAARSGEVVSVRDLPAAPGAIAAVPLADSDGKVRAVVAVHDVPFLALHGDTLTVLGVLGAHAGAALARAPRPARTAKEARRRKVHSFGRGLEAPAHEDGLVA